MPSSSEPVECQRCGEHCKMKGKINVAKLFAAVKEDESAADKKNASAADKKDACCADKRDACSAVKKDACPGVKTDHLWRRCNELFDHRRQRNEFCDPRCQRNKFCDQWRQCQGLWQEHGVYGRAAALFMGSGAVSRRQSKPSVRVSGAVTCVGGPGVPRHEMVPFLVLSCSKTFF